jgi:hypothetical protein
MACSSSAGGVKWWFEFALEASKLPIGSKTNLSVTLKTLPAGASIQKPIWLSSDPPGGVELNPSNPTLAAGETKSIEITGLTVSQAFESTKILSRIGTQNGPVCETLKLTIWKLLVADGGPLIPEGFYTYISSTPSMPSISARLDPGNIPGNADWRLRIEYRRTDREDENSFAGTTAANASWQATQAMGGNILGGKASIICKLDGKEFPFTFYIRGSNPTIQQAQAGIGNNPYYAKAIAAAESAYKQFNASGTLGPNWEDFKDCPNRHDDPGDTYGWGMFQLTEPVPLANQLWSWTANKQGALELMATHRTLASAWIADQEQQQQAEAPNKPLANESFSWNGVTFKKGTARTPIDACAIWKYNGHDNYWPIYWKNATKTWEQRPSFYLDRVCDFLQ